MLLSRDITVRDLLLNRSDVHHVYPRNHLKGQGLTRGRYNQIANFVLAQSEINIGIGDRGTKYINGLQASEKSSCPFRLPFPSPKPCRLATSACIARSTSCLSRIDAASYMSIATVSKAQNVDCREVGAGSALPPRPVRGRVRNQRCVRPYRAAQKAKRPPSRDAGCLRRNSSHANLLHVVMGARQEARCCEMCSVVNGRCLGPVGRSACTSQPLLLTRSVIRDADCRKLTLAQKMRVRPHSVSWQNGQGRL